MSQLKTIKFNEIQGLIKQENDLWVTGEYNWTYDFNKYILDAEEKNYSNPNHKPDKTGIFLHKTINTDFDIYKGCQRLIFFNRDKQLHFVQCEDELDNYYYHISNLSGTKVQLKNISQRDKRFDFANRLGILGNLKSSTDIMVIENQENNEWRLCHE